MPGKSPGHDRAYFYCHRSVEDTAATYLIDTGCGGWPGQLVVPVAKRQEVCAGRIESGRRRPSRTSRGCATRTTSCPGHPRSICDSRTTRLQDGSSQISKQPPVQDPPPSTPSEGHPWHLLSPAATITAFHASGAVPRARAPRSGATDLIRSDSGVFRTWLRTSSRGASLPGWWAGRRCCWRRRPLGAIGANDKVRLAFIGAGSRGNQLLDSLPAPDGRRDRRHRRR